MYKNMNKETNIPNNHNFFIPHTEIYIELNKDTEDVTLILTYQYPYDKSIPNKDKKVIWFTTLN
jgi:hypothetical protein